MAGRGGQSVREQGAHGQGVRRVHSFQWARAAGAVAIVTLHAFVTVHHAVDHETLGVARVMCENVLAIVLARWAVPVFFMMSGALMLDPRREVGWGKALRHAWRMVFVLLTFGLLFCVAEVALDYRALSPQVMGLAVVNLMRGRSWDHLWFVYTMAGFYLITPLLRAYVSGASRRELGRVVLAMVLLMQGVNTLGYLMEANLWMPLALPVNLTWYVGGYYAHTYLRLDRRVVAVGVASLALMVVLRVVLDWSWVGLPEYLPVVPFALMVFLAFEALLERPVEGHPLVALLADYSFGIYLVHPAFQHALVALVDLAAYPAVLADAVLVVVPLVLSVALIWLLRKVPGFAGKV